MSLNSATLITLTSPLIFPHKNLTQQLLFIIILIRLFFQSAVSLFFFSCSSQLLLLFNQLKTEILHSHIMEKTFVLIQELQTAAEKSFNLKKYFWKVCCPSIVYKQSTNHIWTISVVAHHASNWMTHIFVFYNNWANPLTLMVESYGLWGYSPWKWHNMSYVIFQETSQGSKNKMLL